MPRVKWKWGNLIVEFVGRHVLSFLILDKRHIQQPILRQRLKFLGHLQLHLAKFYDAGGEEDTQVEDIEEMDAAEEELVMEEEPANISIF